ncbi:MAG: alginate export family protein [Magnetospirillum sp.]|nr:alginate export family protein [Magnetospirillum sp.]
MFAHDLRSRSLISGAILSAVLGLAAVPAQADVSLFDQNGLKIDGALTAGVTLFTTPGSQFGAGSWTNNAGSPGKRITGHNNWSEIFLAPELKASYETENYGSFYGDVSGQFTSTGGHGEPSLISSTYGHPWMIDLENLYGGWKSAKLLEGLGLDENGLDLSGGRQSFKIADGFLISNGTNNQGKRGMFWTQSRTAFAQTGLVKVASGPVRADVFYLQNNSGNSVMQSSQYDSAKTQLVGLNVELFGNADAEEGKPAKDGASNYADRKWYAGATFFKVIGADSRGPFSFRNQTASTVTNTLTSNREGMNVFSFHIGGNPIEAIPDFSLYGNAVRETNHTANANVDADAYYIEPGYQLSNVMWTPKLSYRYAHFSGDKTPNDTRKQAYDPFFYNAITRGFGTWFIGEIVGNYVISNSNVNINQLVLSINPLDVLKLSVLAYDYRYDAPAQNSGVTSNALAKEIDFTAEWTVTDNIALSAAFGAAKAGQGYKQNVSTNSSPAGLPMNKTWLLGETSLVVKF